MHKLLPLLGLTCLLFACRNYSLDHVDTAIEVETPVYEEAGPLPEPEPEPVEEPAPEPDPIDCLESSTGLDIEQVSKLQDAFGLPMVRDGLSLWIDPIQKGDGWRPTSVEVLIMYPDWYFDFYDDSNSVTVLVYEGAEPKGQPYKMTMQIVKNELSWQPLTLPANADWSGENREQMSAWLTFDVSEIIPVGSFSSDSYFVAVEWDDAGYPSVGYSNFEFDCDLNWTDYSDGTWKQNDGQDCSWPMLKIEVETYYEGDCDPSNGDSNTSTGSWGAGF